MKHPQHFCPVAGLPAFFEPEWRERQVGRHFSTNHIIVGKSILYSAPTGSATLKDSRDAFSFIDSHIASQLGEGRGAYILIEDLARLKSTTAGARKYIIDYFISNERIFCVIFCNTSPLFRLSIKIGQRFIPPTRKIYIAERYPEAVLLAMKICAKHSLPVGAPVFGDTACYDDTNNGLIPVTIQSERSWQIKTGSYANSSALINGSILFSVPRGYLRSEDVSLNDKMRKNVLNDTGPGSCIEHILIDAKNLDGGSRRARKLYMRSLEKWHQRFPIRSYTICGANGFMRTATRLAKFFMPFRIMCVANISDAFRLISEETKKRSEVAPSPSNPRIEKNATQRHADELLAYIGKINWETAGGVAPDDINHTHPFYYVFQSIKLIKDELDDLFKERRQKLDALEKSEKKYRELFEKGSDILCFHDLDGVIINTNLAFKKEYGWTEGSTKGLHLTALIPKRFYPEYERYMKETKKKGQASGLVTVKTKNGKKIVLEYNSVLVNDACDRPLGIKTSARDITERLLAEKENRNLQENLKQAYKMEAIGTLAGGIAHELNNVFSVILGNAELAIDDIDPASSTYDFLDEIRAATFRAKNVVQQLVRFSYKTNQVKRPIELIALVEVAIAMLRDSIPGNITIQSIVPDRSLYIMAEATQIHQVIKHLFSNAVHAMEPSGGVLKIGISKSGRRQHIPGGQRLDKNVRYAMVTIGDNGSGIAPKDRGRIFDPYFTTKTFEKGIGMGLSIVHGIINGYDGRVDVQSKPGAGTTVTVFLPLIDHPFELY